MKITECFLFLTSFILISKEAPVENLFSAMPMESGVVFKEACRVHDSGKLFRSSSNDISHLKQKKIDLSKPLRM